MHTVALAQRTALGNRIHDCMGSGMHPGEETCLGEAGSHMPADSSCKGTRMQGWAVCTLRYTDCKVHANSLRMVCCGLHSTVWTRNRYGTAAYENYETMAW